MGKIKMNLDNLNKRGISDLVVISLMIVFVIALGFLVFSFVSKTVGEESQKGADRANAQDICREEVRIRINDVKDLLTLADCPSAEDPFWAIKFDFVEFADGTKSVE